MMKTSEAFDLCLRVVNAHLTPALVKAASSELWFYGQVSHIGFLWEAGDCDRAEMEILRLARRMR